MPNDQEKLHPVRIHRDTDRPKTPPTPRDDELVDEFGISDKMLQNVVASIVSEAISRASTPFGAPSTADIVDSGELVISDGGDAADSSSS